MSRLLLPSGEEHVPAPTIDPNGVLAMYACEYSWTARHVWTKIGTPPEGEPDQHFCLYCRKHIPDEILDYLKGIVEDD